MPTSPLRCVAIGLGLFGLLASSTPVAAQDLAALRQEVARVGGRVIVGIKPADARRGMVRPGVRALTKSQVESISRRLAGSGLRVTRNYGLITAIAGVATDAAIAALLKDPNVEYVVPDRIHTLQDERGPRRTAPGTMGAMVETIPYGVAKIRAPEAWAAINPANYGAGVKLGILDTGGDFDHVDLAFAGGFDAVLGSTAPADWDDNIAVCEGHGTHVAGTVGAVRGNGLGVVGVAPGASVYAIQIFVEFPDPVFGFPQCGAFTSDILAGVDWAVTNGMQVLNMSYGGLGFDPAEHAAYQAAAAAGVHLIAASGNSGLPASGFTPASYPEVIAVSATDMNDSWASFSNSGPEVLVSAPGVGVTSTLPGNTYADYNGTSMSAPHVTGLAALLLALDPTLSNASLRGLLAVGAIDLGTAGRDDLFGEGRIDALNSVNLATQQATSATQLALVQQPGAGTSGQPLAPAPTVELRDPQNQPVLQAGVVVTATISSGPGVLSILGRRLKKSGTAEESKRLPVEPATTAVVTNASGQAVFSSLTIHTVLTAQHELTFTAGNLTPAVSDPFSVTGSVTTLANGVTVSNLSGAYNSLKYFVLTVPAGLGVLNVTTTGGTGDADLAVQFGVPPTLGSYDCASAAIGNDELCSISNPSAGDWYVMLFAYEEYAGASLTATASGVGATQMSLLQQPQNATSGQPLAPAPAVQLLDAQSQPVALAGVAVTAAISSGPGQVSVMPGRRTGKPGAAGADRSPVRPLVTTVVTNANGQAVFTDLTVTSLATADHELVFSAPNVTPLVSNPFTVTGTTPTPLTNGVPVAGLSGAAGSATFFSLTVPAGQGSLTVTTAGGTGDADLYVKFGALPTTASFTCRSFTFTNDESCTIASPDAGEWYVLVRGFDPFTGVTLTATYAAVATQLALVQQPQNTNSAVPLVPAPVVQLRGAANQPIAQAGVSVTAAISSGPGQVSVLPAGASAGRAKRSPVQPATSTVQTDANGQAVFSNLFVTSLATADHQLVFSAPNVTSVVSDPFTVTGSTPTTLTNGVSVTGLGGAAGSQVFFVIAVPAGQAGLTVVTTGGSGDADLYVRFGSLPTTGSFDCRSFEFTNEETCGFNAPAAGNWYVLLRGFGTYAGVTLTATYSVAVPQYAVTVTGHGTGSGTVTGGGLSCAIAAGGATGTCAAALDSNTAVTLTAAPGASQRFSGWAGDCTGTGTCQLLVTGVRNVTATFSHPPAEVTNMVAELTGTPTLTLEEIQRLDCNATSTLDVGDLLCYLDNNPGLTLAPEVMTAILYRSAMEQARPSAAGQIDRAKRGN